MGRKLRIKFPLAFQATEFGDEVPRPGRRRAYAEMRAQRALTIAITVAGTAVLAQKHRDMGCDGGQRKRDRRSIAHVGWRRESCVRKHRMAGFVGRDAADRRSRRIDVIRVCSGYVQKVVA